MEREKFPFEEELDKPREKCGIVGVYGQSADIAIKTFDALSELQHRGQQAAGITVFNEYGGVTHKKPGKVKENFTLNELAGFGEGHIGVGHVRYQTVDTPEENALDSIQPLSDPEHSFVVAHNGNFTRFDGIPFTANGQSDTAYFKDLVHNSLKSQLYPYLPYAVRDAVRRSEGAYSLIVADQDHLIAVRDKWGFRPLVYGQQADGTYVAASESVALDSLDIDEYRYLEPGQMLVVDKNGPRLEELGQRQIGSFCMMELVYFSRPDTMYGAESVYTKRVRTGERLAEEAPADADVVVGVPGTGLDAAKGYAERLGLPFMEKGIHKTGYERSFLGKTDEDRRVIAAKKFNVTRDVVEGRRVAVVDDSLIRGTVTSVIVAKLRKFGATEVHFRVASPRYTNACHFGIDTGREDELIAKRLSVEETARYIGADSLSYLSLDGLKQALKYDLEGLCDACVSGHYPVPVKIGKTILNH